MCLNWPLKTTHRFRQATTAIENACADLSQRAWGSVLVGYEISRSGCVGDSRKVYK
jgi:hypothetical protein